MPFTSRISHAKQNNRIQECEYRYYTNFIGITCVLELGYLNHTK